MAATTMLNTNTVIGGNLSTIDGLPKHFVNSMRTLFDIMDDQHSGFVKYSEIERRWQEDRTQGLPPGVLESLRKVTPRDGLLSFERFCAGLKMSLVKNKGDLSLVSTTSDSSLPLYTPNVCDIGRVPPLRASSPRSPRHRNRPLSAPILDQDIMPLPNGNLLNGNKGSNTSNTLTNRSILPPNNHKHSLSSEKGLHQPPKPELKPKLRPHSSNDSHGPPMDKPYTSKPSNMEKIYVSKAMTKSNSGGDIYVSKSLTGSKIISSNRTNANSDKIYAAKTDIRMGVGSIKGMSKTVSMPTSTVSQGPPKPPRVLDVERGTQSLERNLELYRAQPSGKVGTERSTHSLEREMRNDNGMRERPRDRKYVEVTKDRRGRGSSLERLLDSNESKDIHYAYPINRTGMRSAVQSWFREKSKSDLHADPKHTTYGILKRSREKYLSEYKENRNLHHYESRHSTEAVPRGMGDGGDHTKPKHLTPPLPPPHHIQTKGHPPPPPPPPPHYPTLPPPLPPPPLMPIHSGGKLPPNSHYPTEPYHQVIRGPGGDEMGVSIGLNEGPGKGVVGGTAQALFVAPQHSQVAVFKKTNKKKEPRRHTLQNGVDHVMMRRLHQLEAERDMLYQGMDVVERARAWYKQQIHSISERIPYLPFAPVQAEPSVEVQQEKLHFQLARIHEVNAHLRALMDASDKGFAPHMNLAIGGSLKGGPLSVVGEGLGTPDKDNKGGKDKGEKDKGLTRLKEQNRALNDEVTSKCEKISALEREKATLLRELFQARSMQQQQQHNRNNNNCADSTFM